MTLARLIQRWSDDLARRSTEALHEARLEHYEQVGQEVNRLRLLALLELTTRCLAAGRADLVVDHARRIAAERFEAGYTLAEVQTSINIVEEVLIKRILATFPAVEATGAICLTNALFHVVKDVLAQTYVELVQM